MVARLEALQKVEEVTEETQVEKNLPKMELPIWFDGKQINEILLYQTILQQHEIKCINGILYDIDRSIPNDEMEKKILNIIEHYWTSGISAKVTAILSGFKMYTRSDPLSIKEDRVHFKNGTYFVNQKFINQKEWTQNRLTVNYNKDALNLKNGWHSWTDCSKRMILSACRSLWDIVSFPAIEVRRCC